MTSHEYPVFAAERNMNPCQHPKSVNPPSIRLLLVLLSEICSKPCPFMLIFALRPPLVKGSLLLSNEMGSVCTSLLPKVTGSVGLASPILRRCISSICQLVLFSLHKSRLSPGE